MLAEFRRLQLQCNTICFRKYTLLFRFTSNIRYIKQNGKVI
jgi:hypothetical protein